MSGRSLIGPAGSVRRRRDHRSMWRRPRPIRIEMPRWVQLVALPLRCCSSGRSREPCVTSCSSSSSRCSSRCSSTRSSAGSAGRGSRAGRRSRSSISPSPRPSRSRSSCSPRSSSSRRARRATGSTTTSPSSPDTRRRRAPSRISPASRRWLDRNHLSGVHVQNQGEKFLHQVGLKDVQKYTTRALNWAEGAGVAVVTLLFDAFLVVVVSIYMLLDMQRWSDAIDRRFPPRTATIRA